MVSSKKKGFYGWWALTGAIIVYFCGCAFCFYSISIFIPILYEELNSSLAVTTGVMSLFFVLIGLAGPLIGISIDRYGARKNIIFGNLLSAVGLAGMYFVTAIWQFYLFFGVITALGQGFGMFVPATTIANNWFIRKRSLAVALIIAAGSIGGFVGPSVTRIMITELGWRMTWLCLSGLVVVMSSIIGGLIIRNKPEDMGQVPDGIVEEAGEKDASSSAPAMRVYQTPIDWEAKDALRTPVMWMLVVVFITHMFAMSTILTHLVFYLEKDIGLTKAVAAFVFGLVPGMSIIGRLGIGVLAMRFELRYLISICLAAMVFSMCILITSTSLPMLYLYAFLFGISYGAVIPAFPSIIGAYFGRAGFAKIVGWTMPVTTIFGAASAPIAGVVREAAGSYNPWFITVTVILAAGSVIAFFSRPPSPKNLPE